MISLIFAGIHETSTDKPYYNAFLLTDVQQFR